MRLDEEKSEEGNDLREAKEDDFLLLRMSLLFDILS